MIIIIIIIIKTWSIFSETIYVSVFKYNISSL